MGIPDPHDGVRYRHQIRGFLAGGGVIAGNGHVFSTIRTELLIVLNVTAI